MKYYIILIGSLMLLMAHTLNSQQTEQISLSDAITIARTKNPAILSAQKEIDAASGRILQAGRIPNPELSIELSEFPTNLNISDADEKNIGVTQLIEFPGKRRARITVAELGKSIAEYFLARTKSIVSSRVKRAYYQSLFAREVIMNLEFTITLLADLLRTVTERYQAGASTYLDVLRSKVELTRLRNDLVEAKREQLTRLGDLNILLGRMSATPIMLTDSLMHQSMSMHEDSVVQFYVRTSNFLQIAESEAQRNQSLFALANTSYLPDFSLGFSLQNRAEQPPFNENNFNGITTRSFGLQFGISVPLWFWQGPRGEVQEAEALLDISKVRISSARLQVQQNILSAFRSTSVAQEQLRSFDTSLLQDAHDALWAGINAYQNNQIDVLNLFDIYRTYRATKIEYARALFNLLTAQAELEVAGELAE